MITAGVFRRALSALCFLAVLLCLSLSAHAQTGSDPLLKAASRGDLSAVLESLNKGANVNAKDKDGWTPLLFASAKGHTKVAVGLLLAGANPNLALPDGTTPLMAAALRGDAVIVKVLLDKGADPAAKNKQGVTATIVANNAKQDAVTRLILSATPKRGASGYCSMLVSGNFSEAYAYFKKASGINIGNSDALAGVLIASTFNGDMKEAQAYYGLVKQYIYKSEYCVLAKMFYDLVTSYSFPLSAILVQYSNSVDPTLGTAMATYAAMVNSDIRSFKTHFATYSSLIASEGNSQLYISFASYQKSLNMIPGVYYHCAGGRGIYTSCPKFELKVSDSGISMTEVNHKDVSYKNPVLIGTTLNYAYSGGPCLFNNQIDFSEDFMKGTIHYTLLAPCGTAYAKSTGVACRDTPEALAKSGGLKAGPCFIATAAFGSPFEAHVQTLRDFRDRYLLTNTLGSWFVTTYYRLSPPLADAIAERGWARAATRCALAPIVVVAGAAMGNASDIALLLAALALCAVSAAAVIRRRRA